LHYVTVCQGNTARKVVDTKGRRVDVAERMEKNLKAKEARTLVFHTKEHSDADAAENEDQGKDEEEGDEAQGKAAAEAVTVAEPQSKLILSFVIDATTQVQLLICMHSSLDNRKPLWKEDPSSH